MIAAFLIQLGLNTIVGAGFFLLGRWTAPQPPEPHRSVSEMAMDERYRLSEGAESNVFPIRGGSDAAA
jgi:hypothetical protein